MRTQPRPILRAAFASATAAALVVVALAPLAAAGYKSFGEAAEGLSTDKDMTHLLLVSPVVVVGTEVAFDDVNTDGAVQTTEGVYIDADGGGTISANDIRIRTTTGGTGTKGDQVKASDSDCCGTPLFVAPGSWGFVDVFPTGALDGLLNLGDPVFLDLDASGTVTTLDIKILSRGTASTGGVPTTSGSSSLSNVAAGDVDAAAAITALAGYALNAYDSNADGTYGRGDTLYIDTDADALPGPGDLRVNKFGSSGAGTMPKAGDADTVHELAALGAPATFLTFADDGDGIPESGEGIYLDLDTSLTVTANDIRLIGSTGTSGTAGKQIVPGDADIATGLTLLPGGLAFRDRNGDTIFDAEDDLYVELDGDATVEVADFRLAKGIGSTVSVGQRVTGSSTDLNAPLLAVAACGATCVTFFDFGGSGGGAALYNRNDVVYLDIDADGLITAGDVRIQAGTAPLSTFGEIITDAETEMEYCFDGLGLAPTFAYVEVATPGTVNIDENVYVDRTASGTVRVHDIRLSGDAGSSGSFVASGSSDLNNPTAPLATVVSFFDANGGGVYSVKETSSGVADTLYLDFDGSGTISIGDLRLTKAHTGSGSAGSRVTSTAPSNELNGALAAAGATTFAAIDSDGDGSFTNKDALYVSIDSAVDTTVVPGGCVTPGDLRLSGTTSSTGTQGGTTPPPPSSAAATIAISAPAAASCVLLNQALTISGTATPGTTQGVANTITSVGVTVNGAAQTVSGTSAWSSSFTPTSAGTLTIAATVTPSSGSAVTQTRSVTAAASCAAPPPPPPGEGSLSEQLQTLISQNTALGNQLNSTLAQNTELSTRISNLSGQLGQQSQQLTNLNSQLTTLQQENARLRAQLTAGGNTTAGQQGTPGFEAALALLALAGAVGLRARRKD